MAAEPNQQEFLLKSRKLYSRFAIICLFALALLHGIHSFFFTFFFWLSVGFGVMALYYHIVFKRGDRSQPAPKYSSSRSRQTRPSQPDPQAMTPESKRFVLLVALGIGGLFVLITVMALFFGGESPSTKGETKLAQEGEKYQAAFDQYDQKNYREAINILKPDLLSGLSDSQSMLLLGDSYYEEKNLDSAYVWYSKAYGLGERSAILSHLMAYILDTKGNTHDAILFYKEAIGQDSARAEIYKRLAELEPEKSEWYLERAESFKE